MRKNKKGFTLVEIIVVLVIIGILMALAVPAVMSYIKKAADTKLISEARTVMVASKEKGIELVKQGKLHQLTSSGSKTDIIKRSEIEDGQLMEIQLNSAKNGAGSFVVKIQDAYVRYDDANQSYEVLDSYNTLYTKAEEIRAALLTGAATEVFEEYFKQPGKVVLNSEGANKGKEVRRLLEEAGLASGDDYSFRVYKDTNLNTYTITISERRVTMDDLNKKEKVNVIQYDYSAYKGFSGTPEIKTAEVGLKLGEDSKSLAGGTQNDYATFDLSQVDWEKVSN
ncbi:MAG: prepilin-type N-terminal cleavage/methylation domain-containing protein [Clostridium sp.]|nr:prepilin-type N-terminal cleavage/methylation domain-containing protein [Clostridium sp.]